MYTAFTKIQEEPPLSQYLIFRKTPTLNQLKFVQNNMQTTLFKMKNQEQVLTLWSGKYGILIALITLQHCQKLRLNQSMVVCLVENNTEKDLEETDTGLIKGSTSRYLENLRKPRKISAG
jgi:hypothetical protein